MLKKIMGKWNAIIRGLRILNREYFSTRNDCLGKCGINSHYLPPTLLGKRENIFLYDNAYIDYRSVLYVTGGKLIIKENSIVGKKSVFQRSRWHTLLFPHKRLCWLDTLSSGTRPYREKIVGSGVPLRFQSVPEGMH